MIVYDCNVSDVIEFWLSHVGHTEMNKMKDVITYLFA